MKVLRVTMYPPDTPDNGPVSMVVRESDLKVPIEEAAKEHEDMAGCFVILDMFDIPGEPDIIEATAKATELLDAALEREQNMALTYYYEAAHLKFTAPHGVLAMTMPAPLSAGDLAVPLRQLGMHPDYRDQTIIAISHDSQIVELRNGEVTAKPDDDLTNGP